MHVNNQEDTYVYDTINEFKRVRDKAIEIEEKAFPPEEKKNDNLLKIYIRWWAATVIIYSVIIVLINMIVFPTLSSNTELIIALNNVSLLITIIAYLLMELETYMRLGIKFSLVKDICNIDNKLNDEVMEIGKTLFIIFIPVINLIMMYKLIKSIISLRKNK